MVDKQYPDPGLVPDSDPEEEKIEKAGFEGARTPSSPVEGSKPSKPNLDQDDQLEITDTYGMISDSQANVRLAQGPVKKPEPEQPTLSQQEAPVPSKAGLKKLSSDQVKDITSKLNDTGNIATARDRESILSQIERPTSSTGKIKLAKTDYTSESQTSKSPLTAAASTQEIPVRQTDSSPTSVPKLSTAPTSGMIRMAPSAKTPKPEAGSAHLSGPSSGVAFFPGSQVELPDTVKLAAGGQISIGGRFYDLEPRAGGSHKKKWLTLAVVGIVLVFAAKEFIPAYKSGVGSLVGITLDENGTPYVDGAVVRIPDLGVSAIADRRGFFRFDEIPVGTYRIEYSLDQSLGGQSSATVRSDDVSLVSLASARKLTRNSGKKNTGRSNKSLSSSSVQVSTTRGMIEILSTVAGAVVYLDNQKLGAVNTTYRKIRPGQRTIIVRKIGYDPLKIRITVKAGELTRVTADLIASGLAIENDVSKAPADPNPTANELYLAGRELFMDDRYGRAYLKLNGAIAEDPSIADAFFIRAQIYQKRGDDSLAGLDYRKAGEIWKSQRRYNDAIASLDQAVLVDGNSATNLKVRGDYYYSRKEYSKAIDNYRAALKIDNRYYPAQRSLAVTMYRKGAYRGADKELRRARDLNPNDATLYHYLMLNSLAKNDLGDVNKYFKEFKKVASDREMTRFMTDNGMEAIRRLVKN